MTKGFTLAETIITVGLTAVLVTGIFSIFQLEQKAITLRSNRGDDVRQGQSALRRLEDNLRQGQNILDTTTISGTTYTTGLHTLVIDVPAIDSTGANISDITDRLVYTQIGTHLQEISVPGVGSVRPSGTFTIAKEIETFNVHTNGDPVVNTTQITLYFSFPPPSELATQVEGQVRATLRNNTL